MSDTEHTDDQHLQKAARLQKRQREAYEVKKEEIRAKKRAKYALYRECPVCLTPVSVGNAAHVLSQRHIALEERAAYLRRQEAARLAAELAERATAEEAAEAAAKAARQGDRASRARHA